MELEGSLTTFSLPEVLQFLAHGKMTGILSVSSTEGEVRLEIRGGKIVHSSMLEGPNKLGEMLVHRGVIPRSALDEALEAQRSAQPGRLIGELLIERGLASEDQLRNAIRLQIEEGIWSLFGWRDGQFKFEHLSPAEQRPAAAEIDIEPLLLEDSRRWDEWALLIRNIPDNNVVFGVAAPSTLHLKECLLQEREWGVLRLLNGRFSVGSIIARTGFGTFETYRILNTLMVAGLAVRRSAGPGAGAEEGAGTSGNAPPGDSSAGAGTKGEPASAAAGPAPSGFWRIGGVLGRRRGGDGKEGAAPVSAKPREGRFRTPVGLCCACLDDLLEALRSNAEFDLGERDQVLLDDLWQPIVNICPKADLLRVCGNRLDAARFESFALRISQEQLMRGCYEDSLEGLSRLLSRLYALASQRIGQREAQRIFAAAREAWSVNASSELFQDFRLGPFVDKAMW